MVPEAKPRPTTESDTSRFVVFTVTNNPFTMRSPATTAFLTLRVSVSLLKVKVESPANELLSLNWTCVVDQPAFVVAVEAISIHPPEPVVTVMAAPARM